MEKEIKTIQKKNILKCVKAIVFRALLCAAEM